MNSSIKILLTIIYLIVLIFVATLFNADFAVWITDNFISFEHQIFLIALITYPMVTYLLFRLWSSHLFWIAQKEQVRKITLTSMPCV